MKGIFNILNAGAAEIGSFEIVTLNTVGMRYAADRELVMNGDAAELSQYAVVYRNGERERRLERRAVCDAATALKLLNDCRLLSWDGFAGPHPKGVSDGTMFTLKAVVNGGKKIYATGSQNFPRHYREFIDGLNGILNGADVIYHDRRYTLGLQNDLAYLAANGRRFVLTCHPHEPCLYIADDKGAKTTVHNAFDPLFALERFRGGETVVSVTGFEYGAEDFCRMVEYAADAADINIDGAERVFGWRAEKKEPEPEKNQEGKEELREDPFRSETERIIVDDRFYDVIAEYPDSEVDYCVVKNGRPAEGIGAHRRALTAACRELFFDCGERIWRYDCGEAVGKRIETAVLFETASETRAVNYRGAFRFPPCGERYSDADFGRVNAALFPNGTDGLEVYEWTTEWSDYFDAGHEWWGALCYTVYDKTLDRFIVVAASATD